jgi:hypothetical protein
MELYDYQAKHFRSSVSPREDFKIKIVVAGAKRIKFAAAFGADGRAFEVFCNR